MIEAKNICFSYDSGRRALKNVSFTLKDGSFTGLTGKTGSGKTTLSKILRGLLVPSSGTVLFDSMEVKTGKNLDSGIGLVFQFPEHQLFGETVLKDVMFGPENIGLSDPEAKAKEALSKVGLGGEFYDRSPLSLSGGEKRRAAIAGILAMDSRFLILDEPSAGLDTTGRGDVFSVLKNLNKNGTGILMVSHNPDDMAQLCDNIILLDDGAVADMGNAADVLSRHDFLVPSALRVAGSLKRAGFDLKGKILTPEGLVSAVMRCL